MQTTIQIEEKEDSEDLVHDYYLPSPFDLYTSPTIIKESPKSSKHKHKKKTPPQHKVPSTPKSQKNTSQQSYTPKITKDSSPHKTPEPDKNVINEISNTPKLIEVMPGKFITLKNLRLVRDICLELCELNEQGSVNSPSHIDSPSDSDEYYMTHSVKRLGLKWQQRFSHLLDKNDNHSIELEQTPVKTEIHSFSNPVITPNQVKTDSSVIEVFPPQSRNLNSKQGDSSSETQKNPLISTLQPSTSFTTPPHHTSLTSEPSLNPSSITSFSAKNEDPFEILPYDDPHDNSYPTLGKELHPELDGEGGVEIADDPILNFFSNTRSPIRPAFPDMELDFESDLSDANGTIDNPEDANKDITQPLEEPKKTKRKHPTIIKRDDIEDDLESDHNSSKGEQKKTRKDKKGEIRLTPLPKFRTKKDKTSQFFPNKTEMPIKRLLYSPRPILSAIPTTPPPSSFPQQHLLTPPASSMQIDFVPYQSKRIDTMSIRIHEESDSQPSDWEYG
ncbi:hypothetical protein BLNAU_1706 [Blattamonas nauphoetae]|uniref:Uncharacterized protein n=1 Tax=Blattamonas nauphoetae TaxID=2049346 RepID=A0ABQ9YHH2_9EUKA|nr:hypothetical protein BLNAU_1706 [Blattamonas nauphoetae]